MEFIAATPNGEEKGLLPAGAEIDVDIGESNDFEVRIRTEEWNEERYGYGCRLFVPGTEYGGMINDIESVTASDEIVLRGDTWRGMLNYKVVEPPANASHLILSGELNQILKELLEDRFGGLFVVSGENSGVQVSQWEVNRYVTLLDAIMSLLSAYKSRLQIRYIEPENLDYGYILMQAVPITDYSDEEEYSKEGNARVTVRDRRSGINHLVCAGEGQNEERAVIHLYVQKDGSIGQVQYYKELEERAAVYNFSSADEERLIEDGTKRLQDLQNQKSCEIEIEDNLELELGDIISGYDPVTDTQVKRPIIRKILKKQNEKVTIEYKIEGDD